MRTLQYIYLFISEKIRPNKIFLPLYKVLICTICSLYFIKPFLYSKKIYKDYKRNNNLEIKCTTDSVQFKNWENYKIAVYTVNFGKYDLLEDPLYVCSGISYICFTDEYDPELKIWEQRIMKRKYADIRMECKYYKMFPEKLLPEYDITIFVDSKLRLWGDLKQLLKKYWINDNMLCVPHSGTNDIYVEIKTCMELGLTTKQIGEKLIKKYKSENYPEEAGLIDSCILVRNNKHDETKLLCKNWMQMIEDYSSRDQLSFNYICWKNKYNYCLANIMSKANPYFYVKNHRKERNGD